MLTRQRAPLQDGLTPLHYATGCAGSALSARCCQGRAGAVRMLLESGADQGAKGNVSGAADLSGAIAMIEERPTPAQS